MFLFCSNKELRLCQAQISIRQALATHPRRIRMELPRHPGASLPRAIRATQDERRGGFETACTGGTRQNETVPLQTPAHALPRSLSLRCRPERRPKNRALVVSQQRWLVDRPMVMDLPPRATRLDEPSGCANSKLEANSGSFAEAFFASNEEMVVIVTLRCEIAERHADSRWSAKQLRIPFLDGRPSSPDTTNRIVHARSSTLRPVGSERFQVGGVEGPVKIDQCVQRASITRWSFSSRYFSWQ